MNQHCGPFVGLGKQEKFNHVSQAVAAAQPFEPINCPTFVAIGIRLPSWRVAQSGWRDSI
jgi:hypothetical protein